MKDRIFLDTNTLVYAHTDLDLAKQSVAQQLVINSHSVISTQVIQELSNTLHRKFKHPWKDIVDVLEDVVQNNFLHLNSEQTILNGCRLAESYKFSFYDSLIISSALESNCSILYSEDLQNGQIIEGRLKIINPFTKGQK